MWTAFLERNGLDADGKSLADLVQVLRDTLWPVIEGAGRGE